MRDLADVLVNSETFGMCIPTFRYQELDCLTHVSCPPTCKHGWTTLLVHLLEPLLIGDGSEHHAFVGRRLVLHICRSFVFIG
eukprot:scaffold179_cov95-Cylindrotheca_fusiformis.AAC.1